MGKQYRCRCAKPWRRYLFTIEIVAEMKSVRRQGSGMKKSENYKYGNLRLRCLTGLRIPGGAESRCGLCIGPEMRGQQHARLLGDISGDGCNCLWIDFIDFVLAWLSTHSNSYFKKLVGDLSSFRHIVTKRIRPSTELSFKRRKRWVCIK